MRKALWILLASSLLAQQAAFEAATIKPSKDDPGHRGWHSNTGMMTMSGHTLKSLICVAYGKKEAQVSGGPKWVDQDRFDINAKAEGAADDPQLLAMLRTLLADRFQLRFHHEERIAPAYAMVLAKSGLKLKPADSAGSKSNSSKGRMMAQGVTMEKVAEMLSRRIGSTVVDLTGAPGAYDFTLEWSTEGDAAEQQSALLAAIQERLGVKLEMRKLPTDFLVIDRAEQPSEN